MALGTRFSMAGGRVPAQGWQVFRQVRQWAESLEARGMAELVLPPAAQMRGAKGHPGVQAFKKNLIQDPHPLGSGHLAIRPQTVLCHEKALPPQTAEL